MSGSRMLKVVCALAELVLAIPVLGGALILWSGYAALAVMLVLHAVTALLASRNREPYYGSVVGIATSLIAWIPLVGWFMHLVTGVVLLINSAQGPRRF